MRPKWKWLILLWVAFIWAQSILPPDTSAKESGRIFQWIAPVLQMLMPDGLVTEHVVRKLAHFSEYAILGGIVWAGTKEDKRSFLLLLFCWLVASVDEGIQIFSGRGASLADVGLDVLGSACALSAATLLGKRK